MNRKLIMSIGMLVFMAAVVAGGTGAFFSDTETSTGNVFAAGSVTLAITDISHIYGGSQNNAPIYTEPNGFSFSLADLKPLDKGTVTYSLNNGANEAYVCAMITQTASADNTLVNPEVDLADTLVAGELGNFLNFKFGTQSGSLAAISGVWQTLGTVAPNSPTGSGIDYCFGVFSGSNCVLGAGDDNLAQTDSLTADVKFYAVQTRNNPNFSCASLNPQWVETARTGADATFVQDQLRGTVLQVSTIADNDSRVRWANNNLNLNLATFTGISFDANRLAAADLVNGNVTMRLIIDKDGDVNTADTEEITYEPYYNIFAHNPLNAVSILSNTWQTWNTTLANGKFWGDGGFLGSTPSGGAYATNFTLSQLLAAHANAKIVGISLGMGTWNPAQTVLVDNLMINGSSVSLEN